jgi:hypothetical protein
MFANLERLRLEGPIVDTQNLRLHVYEWFSRFYWDYAALQTRDLRSEN